MTRQKDRILIRDRIKMDRYDFEGQISDVKERLDRVVEEATKKGMVGEGSIDIYAMEWYGNIEIEVTYYFERYETDEEYQDRMEQLKAQRARKRKETKRKKDEEYQKYLELKDKYEN